MCFHSIRGQGIGTADQPSTTARFGGIQANYLTHYHSLESGWINPPSANSPPTTGVTSAGRVAACFTSAWHSRTVREQRRPCVGRPPATESRASGHIPDDAFDPHGTAVVADVNHGGVEADT